MKIDQRGSSNKGSFFFALCVREIYTSFYEKNRILITLNYIIFMEELIMTNSYVITRDGLRMSYEEYMEMVKAECK